MNGRWLIAFIIVFALILVISVMLFITPSDETTPSQRVILNASDMPGEGWSGSAQKANSNELEWYLWYAEEGVSDACYTFIQRGEHPHNQTVWVFLAHMNSTAAAKANYQEHFNSSETIYVFDLSNLSWVGDDCRVTGYTYNYSTSYLAFDNDNKTIFNLVKGDYSAFMLFASKAGSEFSFDEMLALVKAQADKIPA